jgi:hypothetical protein
VVEEFGRLFTESVRLTMVADAPVATVISGGVDSSLVSAVAAVAGWFLAVRVFGVSTMNEWTWVLWSLAAATLALGAFFLFRSKR